MRTEKSSKRKRFGVLCAFGLGSLAIGIIAFLLIRPSVDDYQVNGVPFRTWVAKKSDLMIRDPIAALGTNALPSLITLLREPAGSPKIYQAKFWLWNHLPASLRSRWGDWYPVSGVQIKRNVFFALRALGPEAKPALPELVRLAKTRTDMQIRIGALVAALEIAPESPEVFALWSDEWEHTNYASRRDLAIYLRSAKYPFPFAAPLLLKEARVNSGSLEVLQAFEFLGEAAKPAIPYMVNWDQARSGSGNMWIYSRLGPVASAAVPELTKSLAVPGPAMAGILDALKSIGPQAHEALSAIQPLLTNSDPTIQMLAAAAIAHIKSEPELAMPVLLDGLEGRLAGRSGATVKVQSREEIHNYHAAGPQAAAILLGEFGPSARAALPALEGHLKDQSKYVRLSAAQAVWQISGKKDQVLPVLIEALDSVPASTGNGGFDDIAVIRAVEIIEHIGPEAREAMPALERVRPFSAPVRRAVNRALARINQSTP